VRPIRAKTKLGPMRHATFKTKWRAMMLVSRIHVSQSSRLPSSACNVAMYGSALSRELRQLRP
jgi:hypothetical protein